MSRPEFTAPPEVFYNASESRKYTQNSRVQKIQATMTLRALELLDLRPGSMVLDVGCGSGLSGEILTEEGHAWIGMDISADMLGEALDRGVEGDLMLADMGAGVPFRAGCFDAVVSISAIQWLLNADRSGADPKKRLGDFFGTLYGALKRGGKVVCQFYPTGQKQTDAIFAAAKTAGFSGGMVVDDPESKKNTKYYLVLMNGESEINLAGVTMEEQVRLRKKKGDETRKQYILRKKELAKRRGKVVKEDSKYTGRKRRARF